MLIAFCFMSSFPSLLYDISVVSGLLNEMRPYKV
jgi:hypothetical protein